MANKLQINSEIGPLRRVLVHTPGPELLAVTPATRQDYLYDDIIDLEGAREEHDRFVAVLRRFSQVDEVCDLLVETLQQTEARAFLLRRSEEVTADRSFTEQFAAVPPEVLAERYVQGWRLTQGPFSTQLNAQGYMLPPLPNLFFTRDAAMVLGNHAIISAMRFGSRWPEEAIMRTLFGFHPELCPESFLYDGSDERRHDRTLEGGDVHPLNPDVIMVGISERTTVQSLDHLSDVLFAKTDATDVIAVVLPTPSTAIHLDMVWTQLDRNQCAVHPPFFQGPTRGAVLHRRRGEHSVRERSDVFSALGDVGIEMEPVFCGGEHPEIQAREQWTSGCNFFAVRPGQVLSYARNEHTLNALSQAGFRVIAADDLLAGTVALDDNDKAVITFPGAELVRGGGGPRCMTCPVWRDTL